MKKIILYTTAIALCVGLTGCSTPKEDVSISIPIQNIIDNQGSLSIPPTEPPKIELPENTFNPTQKEENVMAETLDKENAEEKIQVSQHLIHNNIIPEGGTYYRGVRDTFYIAENTKAESVWHAGENFPTDVQDGDVYVFGDYEYRYNYVWEITGPFTGWLYYKELASDRVPWDNYVVADGWSVRATSGDIENYGEVLAYINKKPVKNMYNTFAWLDNLKVGPAIPATVESMYATFYECEGLTTAPSLHEGLIITSGAFMRCPSLTAAPSLPNTITRMIFMFEGCSALQTAPELPAHVEDITYAFSNCDMLQNPPSVIPASVKSIACLFLKSSNLTGTIEINANFDNPQDYDACFFDINMDNIQLTGTSNCLQEIAATGGEYNP